MKRLKSRICLVFIALVALIISGCSTDAASEMNQDPPADFNFSVSYGPYGKQKVDTFNDVVVKDLVIDAPIEADIALTESEMKRIYNEMIQIDIMEDLDIEDYPECATEPPSYTSWNIQMNGETHSFSYSSFCEYPDEILELVKLQEFIHKILLEKNAYKELPEANGSYE